MKLRVEIFEGEKRKFWWESNPKDEAQMRADLLEVISRMAFRGIRIDYKGGDLEEREYGRYGD